MTGRRLAVVPEAPRRAVALLRVSKERDEMVSPQIQRAAIEDHCARQGDTVVAWLEGIDESASRARSGWWAKLDDAVTMVERGEADVLVAWKLSRVARHRRRWAVTVDRVEVAGGQVESATEAFDPHTSTGRLTRGLLAELNAWESEVKSDQWKEAHERRRRIGLPAGGGARFGYVYDRATGYAPDPEQGPVLAGIYADYLAGRGAQRIASGLNAAGVRTLRDGVWLAGGVLRQMDCGFGAGLIRDSRGKLVQGAQPAVIDEVTWREYEKRRADQRHTGRADRAPRHVLTGLLRCGRCGGPMSAYSKPDRRGEPERFFRCVTWQNSRTCRGAFVAAARAEQVVLAWLQGVAGDTDALSATSRARTAAAAVAGADVARLARAVTRVDAALERLTVGFAIGDVPASAYTGSRDTLVRQREEAMVELAAAERDTAAHREPLGPVARDLLGAWTSLSVERRHQLLGLLVERIDVTPRGRGYPAEVVPQPRW